jgi:hypothetical protein
VNRGIFGFPEAATIAATTIVGVFTPEQFGAVGNGTADDTIAFQNLATALRASISGDVEFGFGKTYSIFPSPIVGTSVLLNLIGCKGVRVDFNGAKFVCPATFTGGRVVRIFHLDGCQDIEIHGYNAEQTTTLAADVSNGLIGIYAVDTNHAIQVTSFHQKYGRSCFECVRTTELAIANRTHGIFVHGMEADTVEYGFTLQKNGDRCIVRGLYGINTARVFDAYNVRQIDVQVESQPGSNTLNDVLLGVYTANGEAAISNTLSDVRIRYVCRAQTAAPSSLTGLFIQQGDATTTAGNIRNVSFDLDVEIITAANTSCAFELFKQANGGGADTTTRSHVFENFRLSGSLKGFANNIDPVRIGQFGTWGGETVRNINFEKLTSTGSGTGAFRIDATGFGLINFLSVVFAHALTLTNDTGALFFDWNCSFAGNTALLTRAEVFRVLGRSAVAASVTGTTALTTLATVTVPANALGARGMIRITSVWSFTNNANNKTLVIVFGATNYMAAVATTQQSVRAHTEIANRNATNSQMGGASVVASFGLGGAAIVTSAADTTAAQNIDFKAQLAVGTDTATLEGYLVEILRAPL